MIGRSKESRDLVNIIIPAGLTSQFIFVAPVACRVEHVDVDYDVAASVATTLSLRKIRADAVAPGAAAGPNVVELLVAPQSMQATARTRKRPALSAVAGARDLRVGDKLAILATGAGTALAGTVITLTLRKSNTH